MTDDDCPEWAEVQLGAECFRFYSWRPDTWAETVGGADA